MTVNPEKIKNYRKLAGIGQRDMANILSRQLKIKPIMPVATYSSKEINGRFSAKEIDIICKTLKITPFDIVSDGLAQPDFSQVMEQLKQIQKIQIQILQKISKR